jgi:hypothetical protein
VICNLQRPVCRTTKAERPAKRVTYHTQLGELGTDIVDAFRRGDLAMSAGNIDYMIRGTYQVEEDDLILLDAVRFEHLDRLDAGSAGR